MLDQLLNTLLQNGPLAAVLAAAVIMLWRKNEAKDVELQAERARNAAAETAERERHATEEKVLQDKLLEVMRLLASSVKGD